ncbi:ATP-binding Cassette (ABC) Superfamily, partial [Achlya hypogyna]
EERGECIQLCGLRKCFATEDGEKIAVHGLNVTMYAGQITALLGHNGAGKTTTIGMLTGLFPPTKGTAYVFGQTITADMDALRASMGVCPQHDVLYDELTVREHLALYAALKAVPDAAAQIDALLAEVGLTEKRHVATAKLSGGQKRKLSVAIALLGQSRVVFLDEPTSGMDPYSRRFTWNVLQRNRENRVMVLTTHFMDEADLLGDRIVILADGRLCCAGSSLFLKHLYGTGYNLTLVKRDGCDVAAVVAFVRAHVADANVLSNVGAEVVLQLPSAASGGFPALLHALDGALPTLGVVEYGISVTTLEEVFLRIAHGSQIPGNAETELREWRASQHGQTPRFEPSVRVRPPSWVDQYLAMLQKRVRVSKRDKKGLVSMVVIPIVFVVLLAVLPPIKVASYLPAYAVGSATEAANYRACEQVLANSSANYECAFGAVQPRVCPHCQPLSYGCMAGEHFCSQGHIGAQSPSPEYPFCARAGGFLPNATACESRWFSHCSLGLSDCNATECCRAALSISPFYPCSDCPLNAWPCYSGPCLKKRDAQLQATINTFLAALLIVIGFAFVPASVVVFIIKEKDPHQNAKYQQMACGSSVFAYWASIWTHDVLFMLLPVAVAVGLLPLYASFKSDADAMLGALALLLTHVLSALPLAYVVSFAFAKHAAAQTTVLVFGLVTGGMLSIVSFLCRLIDFELIRNQLTLAQLDTQYLRWVYLLFPGYALTDGLFQIGLR